jgi:small conductance mechanosensitive channel
MNDQLTTLEQAKRTVVDLAIHFGPRILTAILIFALGVFCARWVGRWAARALKHLDLEPPVRLLLNRIARLLVLILFFVVALQNLGVELLPLVAGLGVAGAGLALATQGVLSNLAAGLSIIFTKPFRVGEYISVSGEEGQVDMITLFSTTLNHVDHSLVVIPNRKVVGEILHNFGRIRQLDVQVGVAYDTELDVALDVVRSVLRSNPRVLADPSAFIGAVRLGDFAINIAVRPWVAVPDYVAATSELNQAILEAFRDRGIIIPFPQRELRVLPALVEPRPATLQASMPRR